MLCTTFAKMNSCNCPYIYGHSCKPLLPHIECTIVIKIKFNIHPLLAYIPVPAVTIPLVPLFKQLNGSYISRPTVLMSDHQSLLANS